jgi:hypothetical protein
MLTFVFLRPGQISALSPVRFVGVLPTAVGCIFCATTIEAIPPGEVRLSPFYSNGEQRILYLESIDRRYRKECNTVLY